MPITNKIRPMDDLLSELRDCFRKWDIDMHEAVPKEAVDKNYRGPGMVVRFFRSNQWQRIECFSFPRKEINLNQILLLLDRLRKAEQQGVSYAGLSSSKDLTIFAENKPIDLLVECYGILGVSPKSSVEEIKKVYQVKASFYHPDRGGDPEEMKRLNVAYETICSAKGIK